ncbi:MAG: hypothetical protein RLZZ597_3740 [Cyanobacteriota bacterium]|jgi:hypothetical protein
MALTASPDLVGPLYLYGLCLPPPGPLDFPPGIEGKVSLVTIDALAALVEAKLDLEAVQADNGQLLRAVLSHDRVLCHMFQQTTLLPLRFGTQLASLDALKAYLTQQQDTYHAKLTALAHQAEYQIKLVPNELEPLPPPEGLKGRDYFLAKKQRLQEFALAQQQQQEERQRLIQAIRVDYANAVVDEVALSTKVYVLVAQDQQDALATTLAQWQALAPTWDLQISEALPPYHFV